MDLTGGHSAMTATLPLLLPPLLLLSFPASQAQQPANRTVREFHIAAVEIGWDYIHVDHVDGVSEQRKKFKDIPQKYIKAVYREYTDSTYTVLKPRPAWTGIQGPVIVTQAGERVVVHFKNLATQPYSISPVGISYWKQSEGAGYDDSTAGMEKEDDAVFPGGYYKYVWDINAKDGPTSSDPECLTYSYSSQVDTVRDANSGLIGALLICKSSAFTEDGQRRSPAFVLLFAVFDESKSWYGEVGERRSRERFRRGNNRKEYHTINGYVNMTLPGLKICQGRSNVIWHLIGMGTTPEIHSIQFQDHSLEVLSHRKVTVEVTPMTFITAEMRAVSVGHFRISCQIHAHRHDGMEASFTVERCPEPVLPPGPDRRNVKHSGSEEYMYDYTYEEIEDMFNTISFQPKRPRVQVRANRGDQVKIWRHYIAIEEVTWDYAPHLKQTDSELQSEYMPTVPHHLDYKYKKAVYVEYTDGTFTQRKSSEHTLLGPLLKGKVNDQIHITLRNLASRQFNIYPIGLTSILPMQKPANAGENDLRTMGVAPNGTFGYIWKLTRDDGPLTGDPQCLTQLYQSTVVPERDLASGLVGTLLVCKNEAIDTRGRLYGTDKEWSVIFAVFDENRSWYFKDNMQKSKVNSTNPNNPEFYNSNVIYSVNGIMFSGRQFVICKTDVAFWHVASVGTQSDFLSVYFTGNLFQHQGLYHSVLTLFPMTGVTIPMEPEVMGEWEVSAFDGSLKSRGMSIQYTVRSCDHGDNGLVDHERDVDDISDYIDHLELGPRGMRPQNNTVLVRVCERPLAPNNTQSLNTSEANGAGNSTNVTGMDRQPRCHLKRVTLKTQDRQNTDGLIPQDVLDGLEIDRELVSHNATTRQRRQVEGNGTSEEISSEATGDDVTVTAIREHVMENRNDSIATATTDGGNQTLSANNASGEELNVNTEIVLNSDAHLDINPSTAPLLNSSNLKHVQSAPERLRLFELEIEKNRTTDSNYTAGIHMSVEYDDYSEEENGTLDSFGSDVIDMRSGEVRYRHYYIAAEEITWDYGIRKPHQLIRPREMRQGMRKFLAEYKKVVFRAYRDEGFQEVVGRGELEIHLGIMGPFIRTEINDVLTVIFKNKASRPYSFHLQGIYDRSQGAGFTQTHVPSAPPGVPGEPVAPGEARTYTWRVTRNQGPTNSEFSCKTGAYYSTVDKERDLHSGLIGPLVICKPGTKRTRHNFLPDVQEFSLLFHTFDETKSWYLKENLQRYCAPPCHANPEDPWYHISNKFAAINGYVAETLPGLLVAQHQQVRWHLLNVGSDGEYHAVHFHGLPFTLQAKEEHRMGVYKLFPGVFGTVEMMPSTVGTWLVECNIGDYQLAGMRARLLVFDPQCSFPLGMKSGRIENSQITASDYVDNWKPHLARLDQSGYINAWIGRNRMSWIQVDLLKPTLLHGVKTQGVSVKLRDNYITFFTVSYSLDQESWTTYRGKTTSSSKTFYGNMDSSKVKDNHFLPPFVARYIRIQPADFKLRAALRLELMGCDLNSCSLPLGLQTGRIPDDNLDASSHYSYMFRSWLPKLARLNQGGSVNAWRPMNNNPHEWLQVDLGKVKRITGVVTQGARSLMTPMMVTEFSVTVSHDKHSWSSVLEENSQREKIFLGNNDPDEEALTVFDPPLFGRYLRIHPLGWINDIALRVEVLGCNTQEET